MRTFLFSLILLFSISVFAQKQPLNPEAKTDRFMKRWTKELNLNADQQAKARPVILQMFTKIENIKNDTTIQNKRAQLMKLKKDAITSFKAVLTSDQAALFDQKMQEMKKNAKEKSAQRKASKDKKGMKKSARDEIDNDDVF
jgi:hypothetical protein